MPDQAKHITFEELQDSHDGPDGHSSASDEDRNAVEVVFDPSNPYRRKSSLVSSDAVPPRLRKHVTAPPTDKAQCIVHHLIEAQRHGGSGSHNSHGHGHSKVHGALSHLHKRPLHALHHDEDQDEVFDASAERGLDRMVEPKGSTSLQSSRDGSQIHLAAQLPRRHTIIEPVTSDSEAGQVDEQEWRSEITQIQDGTVNNSGADDTDREVKNTPPRSMPSHRQQLKQTEPPASPASPAESSNLDGIAADANMNSTDILHSRLLTKKQLSEMAWGVRELSRRLGSLRLRFRVKTIFLLTKIYDEDLLPKTRDLALWLMSPERDTRYTVYLDRSLKTSRLFDVPGLLQEVHALYVTAAGEGGAAAAAASGNGPADIARRLRFWDEGMCRARPHTFDFVITLGGDGTVLYASWLFQRIVPPVLSFSLGSLGFLTKFDFDDFQSTLTRAFTEGVTVGLRLRFEATIMRSTKAPVGGSLLSLVDGDGKPTEKEKSHGTTCIDNHSPPGEPLNQTELQEEAQRQNRQRDLVEELIGEEKDDEHTHRPDGTYEILNEVVVDRGPNATMSYTEIFGDDEHFTSVLADGICVSTPTGSTAYNLAAGGSLCHPENPVMLVTSICAHTLSFRPIILPDTIVLRVGVPYDARTSSWASFDGRERVELHPGDYVTISASRFPFASVQAPGRRSEDWVNGISGKLGWNTRQKQKAFKKWEQ
ncbi:hypothetical protein SCUCBS95973_005343 [Sporothrix curviconia]|uniref:NAD+ kinase n=1 Tax=Sporothrix curviconia TaxID=1260050 RepID=A0ABP0BWS7_9PEZI